MALPRKQLQEKLENITPETVKETMQWILDGHTASLEAVQEERDTFKGKAEAIEALTRERDEWKAKFEAAGDATKIQADFDAYKQQVETEKLNAATDSALYDLAKKAGIQRESFLKLAVKNFNRDAIKRGEDSSISNGDELVEAFKTEFPDFIATDPAPTGPAPIAPPSDPQKKFTREQIQGMSADEINRNWDAIQKSLYSLK